MDRNTLAANRRLGNPTVQEWCDQVRSWKTLKKCHNLLLIRRTFCFCTPSPRVQNTSPMTHKPIELSYKVMPEELI